MLFGSINNDVAARELDLHAVARTYEQQLRLRRHFDARSVGELDHRAGTGSRADSLTALDPLADLDSLGIMPRKFEQATIDHLNNRVHVDWPDPVSNNADLQSRGHQKRCSDRRNPLRALRRP